MVIYRTTCNKLGFSQEEHSKSIQVIASLEEFERIERENKSLKQANSDLTNQLVFLAKGIRTEKIGRILATVPFQTEDHRLKTIQTLANSNLPIETVENTYEPFLKSANIQTTTKLPQKSIQDDFIK
jgi:hypothetical protein